MPQPTIPTTMRSDGAGWSSLPRALAGMMVGAATAAAVAAINRRREILGADGEVFIAKNFGRSAFRARVENPSMPGAGRILVVPPSVGWRCDGTWGSEAPRTRSRDGCAT